MDWLPTASNRSRLLVSSCFGSIAAGQNVAVRCSHPMQMAGQVECKQVVKSVQFPT